MRPYKPSYKNSEPGGRSVRVTFEENNQLVFTVTATLTDAAGGVARYTTNKGGVIAVPEAADRRAVYQRLVNFYLVEETIPDPRGSRKG